MNRRRKDTKIVFAQNEETCTLAIYCGNDYALLRRNGDPARASGDVFLARRLLFARIEKCFRLSEGKDSRRKENLMSTKENLPAALEQSKSEFRLLAMPTTRGSQPHALLQTYQGSWSRKTRHRRNQDYRSLAMEEVHYASEKKLCC